MSLALARKYRPKKFAEVAVQSHVANTLRNAIVTDHIAHAYLFCGPRGTGKTTLARVLAMALNCENRREDREPCGECTSCLRIWSGSASLDVVEIDAASNRGVDDARDLRERAMYAPSGEHHHKIYIIDEAHMLTREAWNALLKILEEPPPRVVFVFATTDPQKIAQAAAPVLSRVQRFDLKRIGPADVRDRLTTVLKAEKISAEPDALMMLARAADGSMRDALSLTDQVLSLGAGKITAQRVRDALGLVHEDEYVALLDIIADRRAGDVFTAVGRLADFGVDFALLLSGLADILRAQLALVLGGSLPDLSEQLRGELDKRKERFTGGDLLRMLTLLTDLEPHFRRSGQQQLLFETLLVRFALLDRTMNIEDVLKGVAAGPASGSSGGGGMRREPISFNSTPSPRAAKPQMLADHPRAAEPRVAAPAPAAPKAESLAADAAPVAKPRKQIEINRLAEHWDDVVEAVRANGRAVLATALAESTPQAVTAGGVVTIASGNEQLAPAIESGAEYVLIALRSLFDGVTRVGVAVAGAKRGRLTEEHVKADRTAMLRKGSPLLDAAIEALDLKLVD